MRQIMMMILVILTTGCATRGSVRNSPGGAIREVNREVGSVIREVNRSIRGVRAVIPGEVCVHVQDNAPGMVLTAEIPGVIDPQQIPTGGSTELSVREGLLSGNRAQFNVVVKGYGIESGTPVFLGYAQARVSTTFQRAKERAGCFYYSAEPGSRQNPIRLRRG